MGVSCNNTRYFADIQSSENAAYYYSDHIETLTARNRQYQPSNAWHHRQQPAYMALSPKRRLFKATRRNCDSPGTCHGCGAAAGGK
jgi:hypothetical protein